MVNVSGTVCKNATSLPKSRHLQHFRNMVALAERVVLAFSASPCGSKSWHLVLILLTACVCYLHLLSASIFSSDYIHSLCLRLETRLDGVLASFIGSHNLRSLSLNQWLDAPGDTEERVPLASLRKLWTSVWQSFVYLYSSHGAPYAVQGEVVDTSDNLRQFAIPSRRRFNPCRFMKP